ncbi:Hemolysin, chromosomal [Roseivivax sp. THAF40]|uniref:calcium-binding protein n=1 Tax=unclassified Roseivivax TaxID=2639302 RepID=UPI0012694A8B|nr:MULTISPECIES: hypothetical protein [unclassified Roseivivax]QFS82636.1 Hemolysin, chromosomal [Roseivivax sp. THAF197b]QFT46405.1 Hemolysin, chromosomal [Roseivivax sp. THAF40]
MGAELLFILLALTPVAIGAGLIATGAEDGQDEFGADPAREDGAEVEDADDLIPARPEDSLDIPGTEEDDILTGTDADELVLADAGSDSVDAGAGADYVEGDDGADSLLGGEGDDVLLGGEGDDVLEGGADDDVLAGGVGADTLSGGSGNDILLADDAENEDDDADVLDGGEGDDALFFGPGDSATGGEGADVFAPSGSASITDFDSAEDVLLVRYTGETAPEITDQVVTSTGLEVSLSNGSVITLAGVTEPLDVASIAFLETAAL